MKSLGGTILGMKEFRENDDPPSVIEAINLCRRESLYFVFKTRQQVYDSTQNGIHSRPKVSWKVPTVQFKDYVFTVVTTTITDVISV